MKRYAFKVMKPWGEGSLELHGFGEHPEGPWVRLEDVEPLIAALREVRLLGTHRVASGDNYACDVDDIVTEALEKLEKP